MTYKLDDDRRKLITEKLLGEKWHDVVIEDGSYVCKTCGIVAQSCLTACSFYCRTFTTDTDMMVVFRKLVDTGKYDIFKFTIKTKLTFVLPIGTFKEEWLFYEPERFCWLVSEWMKEVEK